MDINKLLTGIRINQHDSAPMYLQIANCLAQKILDYSIVPGTKLPPERELARLMGISRTTAINAYHLLEEQGLVSTRIGSGTYVTQLSTGEENNPSLPWDQLFTPHYKSPLSSILRTLVARPTENDTISFAAGMPDPAFYPLDMLDNLLAKEKNSWDIADFGHIPTEGYLPLRRALASWQREFGIQTTPDHILVVSGSQQGLYLTVKSFVEPRDYVIVETPTYLGAIQALESSGARILALPPSNTLNLDLLEDYLIRYRPKLFYTIPTFQNPTGRVMSLQDRQALIRMAARHRLVIVEDDPYSQLYYGKEPPPSLKSLDTYGGVIYMGTFSKVLFPGLRTGWITAAPQVINRLALEKQYIDLHSNNLTQIIMKRCLEQGYLTEHLSIVRAEYRKRRDAMMNAVRRFCGGHLSFISPDGGFYLWCHVQPPVSANELLRHAAAAGVSFVPGDAFYPNGIESNDIRLCFATHNSARIHDGVKRLGQILASGAAAAARPPQSTGRPII